jgi:hypothetical protein
MLQFLIPGMEDAEEADIRSEPLRIPGDFYQGGGAGAEQKVIHNPLVLQRQGREFVRQREDDMRVGSGQQIARTGLDPAVSGIGLTPWTVAIATGVIGDGLVAAGATLIDVSAERGRAATLDGGQHFQMQPVQPVPVVVDETASCQANQIGHLQRWPDHLFAFGRVVLAFGACEGQRVEWARRGVQLPCGDMQVYGGLFQIAVGQQQLNGPQVRAGFE